MERDNFITTKQTIFSQDAHSIEVMSSMGPVKVDRKHIEVVERIGENKWGKTVVVDIDLPTAAKYRLYCDGDHPERFPMVCPAI